MKWRIIGAVTMACGLLLQPSPVATADTCAATLAQTRLEKCLQCCSQHQAQCAKQEPGQLCEVKRKKCLAHCEKQGNMPSDWPCWWKTT